MEDRKVCTYCKEEKLLEEFDRNIQGRLGRLSRCKVCRREIDKDRNSRKLNLVDYNGNKEELEMAKHVLRTLGYTLNDKDNPVYLQFKNKMELKGIDTSEW